MTTKKTKKPARGRPSTNAPRPVLQFRVHQGLYDDLAARAAKNKNSISEEAASLLSTAVGASDIFPGIQQLALLASSAFWHAGQKANNFEGYATTNWMKDPDCYRQAWKAAARALLEGLPSGTQRALAVKELAASVAKDVGS